MHMDRDTPLVRLRGIERDDLEVNEVCGPLPLTAGITALWWRTEWTLQSSSLDSEVSSGATLR